MATIEIDIEETYAFLTAVIARLDAEEFEALMSENRPASVWEELDDAMCSHRIALDRMSARMARMKLEDIEDGEELSALEQLKLRKKLDDLASRYPDIEVLDA